MGCPTGGRMRHAAGLRRADDLRLGHRFGRRGRRFYHRRERRRPIYGDGGNDSWSAEAATTCSTAVTATTRSWAGRGRYSPRRRRPRHPHYSCRAARRGGRTPVPHGQRRGLRSADGLRERHRLPVQRPAAWRHRRQPPDRQRRRRLLDGSDGRDTAFYDDARRLSTVDLAAGFADGHGHDRLLGIESVIGSRSATFCVATARTIG